MPFLKEMELHTQKRISQRMLSNQPIISLAEKETFVQLKIELGQKLITPFQNCSLCLEL